MFIIATTFTWINIIQLLSLKMTQLHHVFSMSNNSVIGGCIMVKKQMQHCILFFHELVTRKPRRKKTKFGRKQVSICHLNTNNVYLWGFQLKAQVFLCFHALLSG
jgi:hypothetical protein